MYQHIQILEREVHWKYGNVVCAACPLDELDTISCDGTINHNSALMHIVYGVRFYCDIWMFCLSASILFVFVCLHKCQCNCHCVLPVLVSISYIYVRVRIMSLMSLYILWVINFRK